MHTCDSGISLKLCNILNFISVLKASVKLLLGLSHTLAVQIEPESSVDSYTKLEYLHLLLFLMIPPTLFVLKGHFRPVILAVEETEFLLRFDLPLYVLLPFSPGLAILAISLAIFGRS